MIGDLLFIFSNFSPTGNKKRKKRISDEIDFQLSAQFDSFFVHMLSRQRRLTEISIGGLKMETTMRASHTVFTAGLKQFQVVNPNGDVLYREIASIQEDQAVQFDVSIFNSATENENYVDMNAADLEVNLQISRLKIVYLSNYMMEVLGFIDHFQTAKQAVIEASYAATSAAKQKAEIAYFQAKRIFLNIEIQAPYIIVPQTSNNSFALVVDLGRLTVKNHFELRAICNEIGLPAVVDFINVRLQELGIYLATVSSRDVKPKLDLIQPLSFNLNLVRNLTTSWYTDEPDLTVDLHLGQITFALSQKIYRKTMKIIFGNITEPQESSISGESIDVLCLVDSRREPSSFSSSEQQQFDSCESCKVSFAFNVTLVEIVLDLFDNVLPKKSMTFAVKERPFCRISVQGFNVNGCVQSKQSIRAKVTMQELLIEDTSPLNPSNSVYSSPSTPDKYLIKQPICRILHLNDLIRGHQMLEINLNRTKNTNYNISVQLNDFTFVLCPNYLLRLKTFFTSGLPKSEFTAIPSVISSTPRVNRPAIRKQHTSSPLLVVVDVVVGKSEIFLIDRIDSVNTDALLLSIEAKLSLAMKQQSLVISSTFKFHIVSCLFDPALRNSTMITVLNPCCLTVKSSNDELGDTEVNVDTGDIFLTISPHTIRVLTLLLESSKVMDNQKESEEPKMTDWSNIWDAKPLASFNFPFFDEEEPAKETNACSRDSAMASGNKIINLTYNHLSVIIEIVKHDQTWPFILFESTKMKGRIKKWSNIIEATADLNLEVAFFNRCYSVWEPLLEPVDCTEHGIIDQRSYEFTVNVSKCSSKLELTLKSTDSMELTVTRSFLDNFFALNETLWDAAKQVLPIRNQPLAPYVFHNKLDTNVVIHFDGSDLVTDILHLTERQKVVKHSLYSATKMF